MPRTLGASSNQQTINTAEKLNLRPSNIRTIQPGPRERLKVAQAAVLGIDAKNESVPQG